MDDLILQKIDISTIDDGDVLVFKSDDITADMVYNVKERLQELTSKRVGVMVVGTTTELSILKNAKPQTLKVKKLRDDAVMPIKGSNSSAGWDLMGTISTTATDKAESWPGDLTQLDLGPGESVRLSTGLSMEIPEGMFGMLRPRSSAFGKGLMVNGTIDSDYRGEVFIVVRNVSKEVVMVYDSKCYAQLILVGHNANVSLTETTELSNTERGEGGFGSTGRT